MVVLNVLEGIFNIIFAITVVITFIVETKKVFEKSSQKNIEKKVSNNLNDKTTWEDNVKLAIVLSTIVLLIAGLIFVVANMKKMYWLIVLMGVPIYLERIKGAYSSFGIVEDILKSNDRKKLSIKEKAAIKKLAFVLFLCESYYVFDKIIEQINACHNLYIFDVLMVATYVLIFYLYIFFICSLLPEVIFYNIKVLKKIYVLLPWKHKIKRCGDFWINKIDDPIMLKPTLISMWKSIGKWKKFISWIRYLLLPVTFVLDIIIMVVNVVIMFITSSIGYIFVLARMIKKTSNRILSGLLGLSDKRIVAISFRVALILALVCIVVLNRYQPIFKVGDASTAILEFVASAIIIPVVFEWINSIKSNKTYGEMKNKDNIFR